MRWPGTCEWFADVECGALIAWITAIPFEDWPQQHKVDSQLRPAMVSDVGWHRFGAASADAVAQLSKLLDHPKIVNRMLSVVMPGHSIDPHKDELGPDWEYRVHLPLVSNKRSRFYVDNEVHCMRVGSAYRVNISKVHSVINGGGTPRIHLVFDCYGRM